MNRIKHIFGVLILFYGFFLIAVGASQSSYPLMFIGAVVALMGYAAIDAAQVK